MQYGITNENETAELLDMVESRNLTIHTYNVNLADEVAHKIPEHYDVIHAIITRTVPDTIKA